MIKFKGDNTTILEMLDNDIRMTSTTVSFQLGFTCSKLTIETLEQGMKYVQS